MGLITTPYTKLSLTANGGSDGKLTVSSTTNLYLSATVFLVSGTQPKKALVIDSIIDATTFTVRDPDVIGTVRFNCSAYLTADTATITQPPQSIFNESVPSLDERSSYFERCWQLA